MSREILSTRPSRIGLQHALGGAFGLMGKRAVVESGGDFQQSLGALDARVVSLDRHCDFDLPIGVPTIIASDWNTISSSTVWMGSLREGYV